MAGKNDAGFDKNTSAQTLRKRAEERLAMNDKSFEDISPLEMSKLIHELQIHQIELEMQNEELRKNQAETERSLRAYQTLWELSPAEYLIVDAAGRITAVNRAGRRLFGRPESALLNERFITLVAPENQAPVHLMFERAMETGIAEGQEVRILRSDGAVKTCLLEVRSLGGASGREEIQAILTDITELKKANEALKNSEKRFTKLYKETPIMMHSLDTMGKLIDVNNYWLENLGYKKEEVIGKAFTKFLSKESRKYAIEIALPLFFEKGEIKNVPYQMVKKNGEIVDVLLSASPEKNDEEKLIRSMAVSEDITERKALEEALRKSEQEKTDILDSLVEHVVYHDLDMRVLWANRAACESVHTKREDLMGRYCYEIWADQGDPCKDCPVKKARATDQPQMVEKMTPDGRWWYIKGHPVRDQNGHVTGMAEVTLDITERKRAEEAVRNAKDKLEIKVAERTAELIVANEQLSREIKVRDQAEKELRTSEKLLSATFDALQDLLIVIDKDLRVVISNWKDHEYISKKERQRRHFCYEALMNRKKPCNPCHVLEVFATGEIKQHEVTNPIDGKVRDIRVLPIFDDKGKVAAVIEHLCDITDRKQTEAALKESEEKLRQLSSSLLQAREVERQRISFGLHDELGQDLAVLKIQLSAIERALPEDQEGLKKTCADTRKEVDRIVENVRRISRGLSPTILHDLGLSATLKWLVQDFTRQTSVQTSLEIADIDHHFPEDAQVIIYRIFQEALTNIRKHAQATHVAVAIAKKKDRIAFTIEDNGRGFDMQEVAARDWPEKGLGLTTMEERARILGGPLERFSQKGQGTRISLTIPIHHQRSGQ